MSSNINQIYNANPAASMQSTDLMYLGRSPYGAGSDFAITYGNFSSVFSPNVLTTKGDLYTYSTTSARLSVGALDGQILQVSSGAATGLAWSTATYPQTTMANQILYTAVDNVVSGLTTANSAVLTTSNVGTPLFTSMTDGQLLIGSTSGGPTPANLTAGTGISISSVSGSITITANGGGLSWVTATSTTQAMAANTGYIPTNSTRVVFTLPTTAAVGTVLSISGTGAGGWSIAQATGQIIQVGSSNTTRGVTGSLSSTSRYDSINFVCVNANIQWNTTGAPQGNLTIV